MNARLAELEAAGAKASAIRSALHNLEQAERTLSSTAIRVKIPHDFIVRQAINEVIDARRKVVMAGGELPTASEQVQRGRP